MSQGYNGEHKNTRLTEFLILLLICAIELLVELASSAASQRRWSALKKLLWAKTNLRVLTPKISQIWTDHIQHSNRSAINNWYTLSCLFTQRSLILQMQIFIKLMKFIINNTLPLWEKRLHFIFMLSSLYYAPVMSFYVFNSAAFLLLMETKGCSSIINVNLYKKHCPPELSCPGLSNYENIF